MKKLSILVISFLLILALTSVSFGAPSIWAKSEVDEARAKGLVVEEADQNFQDYISRELFCKLIVRAVEQQKGAPVQVSISNPFTDTVNNEIVKAYQLGIVKGISATQFAPNNLITRQEVAVMMMRAFRVLDAMNNKTFTQNVDVSGVVFNDEANIAFWALQDVKEAFKLNLVKGVGNNTINPLGNTTVEQSILLTLRLFNETTTTTGTTTTTETTTQSTGSGGQPSNPPVDQPPQAKSDDMSITIIDGIAFEIEASDIANDDDEMIFKAIELQKSVLPNQPNIKVDILSNGKLKLFSDDSGNIGKTVNYEATVIDSSKNSVGVLFEVKVIAPTNDPLVVFDPAILNVNPGQTVTKPIGRYIYFAQKFAVDSIEPSADDIFGQLTSYDDPFTGVAMLKFVGNNTKANANKSKTYKITLKYGNNVTKSFDLIVKYGNSTYYSDFTIDPSLMETGNSTLDPSLINTTAPAIPPGGNDWPKPKP